MADSFMPVAGKAVAETWITTIGGTVAGSGTNVAILAGTIGTIETTAMMGVAEQP
jgi:hypothetical protein